MREILTYLAMFQVVLSVILYVCIVAKWYFLKSKITANSWEQMSPCSLQSLILFLIPVFGAMSFLAAMTIMDDAARFSKEETGNHLDVLAAFQDCKPALSMSLQITWLLLIGQ